MVSTLALLSLAGSAAAQAVTGIIVPSSTPPAGCANSRDGSFAISIVNASTPAAPVASNQELLAVFDTRSSRIASRQSSGTLTMSLDGGVLTDQDGRTGYIASNYQFQFDKPPQAGAIYTGGFSMCQNGSLALGGNAVFWSCLSGTFYNLYDRDWAPHCEPVYFYSSTGAGTVFTTSPPGPQSTGPSQNTIANGGGTQSRNMTVTGFGGKPSTAASGSSGAATTGASGTGAQSSGAQSTGASAASGSASGSGSGTPSSSSSAGGAAGALATQAPQALFALAAAGFMGAIALV